MVIIDYPKYRAVDTNDGTLDFYKYTIDSTEKWRPNWLSLPCNSFEWFILTHNGRFGVRLKILDQMGSDILVVDLNGTFGLIMVDFVQYLKFRPDQLTLLCYGF